MVKEIGGYFGLDQFVTHEYYSDLIALNTGRNALLYLMKTKNISKIYIPYFLCDSISHWLSKHNYEFSYYNIDENFQPILKGNMGANEYILIINYFGQLQDDKIIEFKSKYRNIILDNTQSFFQKPLKGIDTLYSCRKFLGVPDGAYLSTDLQCNEDLELDISKDRMEHIIGRYEGTGSDYYNDFQENDRSFKNEPLKRMSKLTKNILGAIDYDKISKTRNQNYHYLNEKLSDQNKLQLIKPDVAFSYPLFIKNGIKIRQELVKKKIYIPTLWPNVLKDMPEDSIEYQFTANILPLPCDQRIYD